MGSATWDLPIYEELFRTVRTVNASLPHARQLRVLLGDPPIDWERVHSSEDFHALALDRDGYVADVVRREVLAKGRRALIIYGQGHLQRRDIYTNFQYVPGDDLLLPILERDVRTRVVSVWTNTAADLSTVDQSVTGWPVPTLVLLHGSALGKADYTFYFPDKVLRFSKMGSPPIPPEEWRSFAMEDQFDAVLYLGTSSAMTMSPLSPALCADPAYMEMRLRRIGFAGSPQEQDQLKQYCASVTRK